MTWSGGDDDGSDASVGATSTGAAAATVPAAGVPAVTMAAAASNAGITTHRKRKGKNPHPSPEQLRDSPEEEALSPVPLQDEEEVPQASGLEDPPEGERRVTNPEAAAQIEFLDKLLFMYEKYNQ